MKFTDLELHPLIQAGIESQNYADCTPIQEAAIPPLLKGLDLAGLAQTGTGKTAAFLIPLMDRVVRSIEAAKAHHDSQPAAQASTAVAENSQEDGTVTDEIAAVDEASSDDGSVAHAAGGEADSNKRPIFENWRGSHFVLVLVPTRELAEQVSESAKKLGGAAGLSTAAIYGGTSYEGQKAALKKGVQFVVATPGRLIDLFKEQLIDLNQVRAVIFDEADRMFDMGFKDDMIFILRRIPKDRQFLVFSATLNFDVLNTAYEFGAHPVEVNVSRDQAKAENVTDEIFHVGHYERPMYLLSLMQLHKPRQAIIFSNFKHNVERISKFLTANSYPAMAISSLLTQAQRNRVMDLFKAENEMNILVATDLAARGLDIKGVDLVINFELPDDPENYVHRIGRTGRAGATGLALSLVSERDVEALSRVEGYLGHKIKIGWIEEANLIKEFKPFPADESRPRFGNREGGGRDGGRRFDRGGKPGGPRPERQDRGPRPERNDRGPRPAQNASGPHREQKHGEKRHQDQQRPAQQATQQKHTHRPAITPVAPMGMGTKIKLFFKKLFGGGSSSEANGKSGSKANGHHRPHGDRHKHGNRHGNKDQKRHGANKPRPPQGPPPDQKARVNKITLLPPDPNKSKNN